MPELGEALSVGVTRRLLDAAVLAEPRIDGEAVVSLGPREQHLLSEMPWPLRRSEWLAGRKAAKALLAALGLEPERVEILPLESGAPAIHLDGAAYPSLALSLTHTHRWAVAAVAHGPVGVDACDDADGHRLERIASRVFSDGEAEACGAHRSPRHQAAVWALKEAALKLHHGGVFDPGARSVTVAALTPPALSRPILRVALARLPDAAVALARPPLGPGASASFMLDVVQL